MTWGKYVIGLQLRTFILSSFQRQEYLHVYYINTPYCHTKTSRPTYKKNTFQLKKTSNRLITDGTPITVKPPNCTREHLFKTYPEFNRTEH